MFERLKAVVRRVVEFNAYTKKMDGFMSKLSYGPDIIIEEIRGGRHSHVHRMMFVNMHTREIKHYENGEPMRVGTERPECPYCGEELSSQLKCPRCEKFVSVRKVWTSVGDENTGEVRK